MYTLHFHLRTLTYTYVRTCTVSPSRLHASIAIPAVHSIILYPHNFSKQDFTPGHDYTEHVIWATVRHLVNIASAVCVVVLWTSRRLQPIGCLASDSSCPCQIAIPERITHSTPNTQGHYMTRVTSDCSHLLITMHLPHLLKPPIVCILRLLLEGQTLDAPWWAILGWQVVMIFIISGNNIHYPFIAHQLLGGLHSVYRPHSPEWTMVVVCRTRRLERPRHVGGREWGDDYNRVYHPLQLMVHRQGASSDWMWREDCSAGVLKHTQ